MRRTPVSLYFTVKNFFGNLAALNTYQKLEVNMCAIKAVCIHRRRGNSRPYILCKGISLTEQQKPTHLLIFYSPLLNAVVNSCRNTLLRNTTVAYLTLKKTINKYMHHPDNAWERYTTCFGWYSSFILILYS